jgi:hypothetical protein
MAFTLPSPKSCRANNGLHYSKSLAAKSLAGRLHESGQQAMSFARPAAPLSMSRDWQITTNTSISIGKLFIHILLK